MTLVAQDILRGRYLLKRSDPLDWVHVLISCLCHDIGYVRRIVSADRPPEYVVDLDHETAKLPRAHRRRRSRLTTLTEVRCLSWNVWVAVAG